MKPVTEDDYRTRIERVIKSVSAKPEARHSLEQLARIPHFSPFHFHRIYRAMVGESVAETARRLRLARAAHLLATTEIAITEVALEVGFESVQTFSRAFRTLTRVSPSVFRNRRMQFAGLVVGPKPKTKGDGEMNVEIVQRSPIRVWVYRHQGPMAEVGKTYSRLWQWQIENGIAGKTEEAVGIYYGADDGGDEGFRYYAGIEWDKPVKINNGVESHQVPGGKYCSYRLKGPYEGIHPAIQRLYGEWLPSSGYVPDDRPCLELYRNNPFNTPANELITDLLIPIR